jgi:hypothetical protein
MVHESGALPVWHDFHVLAANVYDSLFGAATDKLQVDIEEVDGDATAAANLNSACDNYSATRGLTGTAVPAVAADGAGGLPISDAGGLDLDTKLANTNEITAARMGALTDWINGGRLDLILDIIAADTTTDIPALIATAQADLDVITGAAGVVIADGALTAAKFAADALAAGTFATGCLTADAFAADALAAATFGTGCLTADAFAADALVAATFATGAFTADAFAADALVAATFATDSITSDALAASAVNEIWDATEAITGDTHSFETILARLYMFLQHKMNITDATGAVALRNTADDGDVMTQSITDNDTTTVRTEGAWV